MPRPGDCVNGKLAPLVAFGDPLTRPPAARTRGKYDRESELPSVQRTSLLGCVMRTEAELAQPPVSPQAASSAHGRLLVRDRRGGGAR
jgi:hypothetical protein